MSSYSAPLPLSTPHSRASNSTTALKPLPETEVIGPDANGIKTIISYKYNDKKQIVKVTEKVQVTTQPVKMHKSVLERNKNWVPFGLPKEVGNDGVVTISIDEIKMERKSQANENEPTKLGQTGSVAVTPTMLKCSICGGLHFTKNCPVSHLSESVHMSESEVKEKSSETTGHYVPPNHRNKKSDSNELEEEEEPTIRISNISTDTTRDEIYNLCVDVLKETPRKINIPMNGNQSRGVAFVTFYDMETAKLAVKELNDCALSYMIIHVTLASSRKKSNTNSRKPKRSYLSGYGKALPQTAGKH